MERSTEGVFFLNQQEWRDWLEINHEGFSEIWIRYYKKHTGKTSIIYREALEEALCYGWIDGIIKRIDDETYIQRFTPRKARSNWSEVNIRLALLLEKEGRMKPAGLKFRQYWVPGNGNNIHKVLTNNNINSLEEALSNFPRALSAFTSLSPSHQRHYIEFIYSAKKEETRLRRLAESIALLEKGEKLGMK